MTFTITKKAVFYALAWIVSIAISFYAGHSKGYYAMQDTVLTSIESELSRIGTTVDPKRGECSRQVFQWSTMALHKVKRDTWGVQ